MYVSLFYSGTASNYNVLLAWSHYCASFWQDCKDPVWSQGQPTTRVSHTTDATNAAQNTQSDERLLLFWLPLTFTFYIVFHQVPMDERWWRFRPSTCNNNQNTTHRWQFCTSQQAVHPVSGDIPMLRLQQAGDRHDRGDRAHCPQWEILICHVEMLFKPAEDVS